MKKINNIRAFSINKHPLFGRGIYSEENPPKGVTQSPFYWWYKFLRLNKEYELTLKGKKTSISKSLVKDFGDLKRQNFKSWWQERVDLFAEPTLHYKMTIANNSSELAPFNNKEVINLVVPLNWTNVGIKRSFARIIDKLVPRVAKQKRGVRTELSEAKYKIGRKWSIPAFEVAYRVYVEKQKADIEAQKTGKKVYWADIAIRAKLPVAVEAGVREGQLSNKTSDIRRSLTILANRHYKRAEGYIKAAASKQFP